MCINSDSAIMKPSIENWKKKLSIAVWKSLRITGLNRYAFSYQYMCTSMSCPASSSAASQLHPSPNSWPARNSKQNLCSVSVYWQVYVAKQPFVTWWHLVNKCVCHEGWLQSLKRGLRHLKTTVKVTHLHKVSYTQITPINSYHLSKQ